MTTLPPPGDPAPTTVADPPESAREVFTDLGIVLAWFVVAAGIGALIWWRITPLPEFTRTPDNGSMDEQQLARQFASDGWFVVVAAVAGLLSGIILMTWRRRDPILTVVLVGAGAGLAGWLMARTGLMLGPVNPDGPLRAAAVGARVPVQLKTHADADYFVWPIAALTGALIVLWQGGSRERRIAADAVDPRIGSSEPR